MSALKISLLILAALFIAVVVAFYFSPFGPGDPYHRFHQKSVDYYSRLASACDSVLREHPHFTRYSETSGQKGEATFTWSDPNGVSWNQVRLSPIDSSLPDLVRELHPDYILLAPSRVFIGFGVGGRLAWSIWWVQDDMETNRWILHSNGEGLLRRVYERKK
ncbi:MAG: hypothetical protein QOJ40_1811 [Verrucomicrobiota bacterium]